MAEKPKPTTAVLPLPKSIVDAAPTSAAIALSIKAISIQLETLRKELRKVERDPVQLARAFVCLRRLDDRMDLFQKEWTALFDSYKKEVVPQAFDAAGISHVPLDEGYRVGRSSKLYCSIIKEVENAAFQWLRKHKLGDLIQPTVNASSLSAAARYRIEEQNLDMPENLFKTTPVDSTSVTSTKERTEKHA